VYGTTASGYAGWFNENVHIAGSCTGCVMAYIGLNVGDSPLETGDLVAINSESEPLAGASVPLLRVEQASASNAGALVGVVHSRGRLAGRQGVPGQEIDNLVHAAGPAAPGDYLFIAVQGLVQVKASAKGGTIHAGEALALDGSLPCLASRVLERGPGLHVGRAMESLERGSAPIWVMLDLEVTP
jgi:hypothetical protein